MIILSGNHPPEDARLTRPASTHLTLHVRVVFALRDREALDRLLSELQDPASPRYRRWLTSAEFERRFGQPKTQINAVKEWLSSKGFRISHVDEHEIAASATVEQVQQALSVAIEMSDDGLLYGNRKDPEIPARFAGVIGMIDGLDNLRRSKALAKRGMLLPNQYYFKPSDFYTFYNEMPLLNAGIDGRSLAHPKPGPRPVYECGMAFAEDSDYLESAVQQFNTTYSLPNLPHGPVGLNTVYVGSNPGRNHDEDETLLDIEWGHAVAPGAIIWVYISGDVYDLITRAISDNRCGAVSISFSFCGASTTFYQTLNSLFAKAVAHGQSVFVSSDDVGAAVEVSSGGGCAPGNSRGVNEMAASQNVTAVGGTQFTPTYDGSGNVTGVVPESAWDDNSPDGKHPGATGGGQSAVFDKPAYQNGVTPNDQKRDVPDIAFGASWNSAPGFWISKDVNGQPQLASHRLYPRARRPK